MYESRKHDQIGEDRQGHPDGEDNTQAGYTLMGGERECAETDDRGERAVEDGAGRGAIHEIPTFFLQGLGSMNEVDSAIDPDAQHQGDHDHVGKIERDIE